MTPARPAGSTLRYACCGTSPYGRVLLTLTALGIASFGVYCFVWSRHAKH